MRFAGHVRSAGKTHVAEVAAGDRHTTIPIAPRANGSGSSITGGELLMLALATCYCNDLYREAAKMGIEIGEVDVECEADFAAEGAPASNVVFTTTISAQASQEQIRDLAARADALAEIQNTVRQSIPVSLGDVKAISS